MRRKLLFIFALLLTAATGAWGQTVDSGTCGATGHESDVTWTVTGTSGNYTLTISKVGATGAMADYKDSSSSRPWYNYRSGITSVYIGNGITNIGDEALKNFANLTSLSIGSTLESIGFESFCLCKKLSSISIPASVKSIGGYAFNGCSALSSVTFGTGSLLASVGDFAFCFCENLNTITFRSNPSFNASTFSLMDSSPTISMILPAHQGETGEYWLTFYNENYNFMVPSTGVQIFKAALTGTSLALTKLTSDYCVTKNNAVILKSTKGTTLTLTYTTSDSGNNFSGNNLTGVTDPVGITAATPSTTFVLNTGTNGVGFYKLQSGKKLGVGKAYLTYSGALAPEFLGFENDVTAIEDVVKNQDPTADSQYFNLNGQRVAQPTKGLYIVNGKKVIIK